MSKKTFIPVEITGKILVPVDLSILETLRTEMMGEALHDQIVEEALRVGVSTCLAGYDDVTLKRELIPFPKAKSTNKKSEATKKEEKNKNKNQQQLLEEEAEKMKNQDDDDEGFPATKKLREEQKSSEIDSNASRFDGQRFIASVNFSGLQGSIERLLNAFDGMASKVDESINGPLAELEKLKSVLPSEAVDAIEKLKSCLENAIAPPAPPAVPSLPVSRYENEEEEDQEKPKKKTNRISGTVVSVEDEDKNETEDDDDDEDGPTVEGKSLLAPDSDEDDEEWKNKNPADMGYQMLADE
jgi:hypothetical protein